MTVSIRKITDREDWLFWRSQDVTASVAAALFGDGVHPFCTAYKLWALKSGLISEDPENAAMRRGRRLEHVALGMLCEQRPEWKVEAGTSYYRAEEDRIGGTPDAIAWRPDMYGQGIVQIKTAGAYSRTLKGDSEIPLWIAVQAMVEAFLTGSTWAAVAVYDIEADEMTIVDVPLNPMLWAKLQTLVEDFWRRVKDNDPYPPNFQRDAAVILGLYADDDGSMIDLSNDAVISTLVEDRERLKDREGDGRKAGIERQSVDAAIIHRLGNAERARLPDGRIISAKTVRRKGFTVADTTYRQVKIK